MTDSSTPSPVEPPISPMLTYDGYVPIKDVRSRRLLPGYWLGTVVAGILYGAITTPIYLFRNPDVTFGPWIQGFILSLAFAVVFILPDTLFLGLTIWGRTKFLKQVRFAKFRTAIVTGFLGGLYPLVIPQALSFTADTSLIVFFCGLAWHTFYPIAAGFWLCYRSNLRD